MVPVIVEKKKEILQSCSLESMFLQYFCKHPIDMLGRSNFSGNNLVAYNGYIGNKESIEIVQTVLSKPSVKGIDYSNNIYCFLGIHLASPILQLEEIDKKFNLFSLKNKYAVSLVFPKYRSKLESSITMYPEDTYYYFLNLLFNGHTITKEDEDKIFEILINNENVDAIDIVLYEQLLKKFNSFEYKGLSSVELIKGIFENFQDSIKHLTMHRRKNHDLFKINDEYDVQDLSYVMLRGVFPDLQFENPHFKSGGTNSIVDLMIEQEGIDIELKMIKEKDKNEKEFIRQLKVDFNDYATWAELKDLIVFVYDPYNKTTNKNNFYSLAGSKTIDNVTFNVHVIVSN